MDRQALKIEDQENARPWKQAAVKLQRRRKKKIEDQKVTRVNSEQLSYEKKTSI